LVRELSQEFKKEINFESEGADTELDKTIIESLADPLMHIIRNSIDHGIESPEVREKIGKNRQGKLKIRSYYSGTNVHIEVSDDGAGIDLKKIQEKAIERELISEDANLSDNEILRLVFLPGFSTATEVTNVSGRGVGMDVVKRKISDIRGEVDIETELGKGTSITIKLPLTLSIIDGLLVKIDDTHFVIPLSAVNKVYDHKHEDLVKAVNNLVLADEDWVPFLYLREIFEIDGTPPELEQVIVVEYNDMRMGLAVDSVVGEYQAVLKSLGRMYKDQDFISGSTILGDGTVALVMDTNKIINKFSSQTIKI
jgi:two-component system chemotaxis sensor kinase CheA